MKEGNDGPSNASPSNSGNANHEDETLENVNVEKEMAEKKSNKKYQDKMQALKEYIPALRRVMDNMDTDNTGTSVSVQNSCRHRLEIVYSMIEKPKKDKPMKYECLEKLERILKTIATRVKVKKTPRVGSPSQKSPLADDEEDSQSTSSVSQPSPSGVQPGPSGVQGKHFLERTRKDKPATKVSVEDSIVLGKCKGDKKIEKVPRNEISFSQNKTSLNKKGFSKNSYNTFDDLFTPDPNVSRIRPGTSTDPRSYMESGTHRPRFSGERSSSHSFGPRGERYIPLYSDERYRALNYDQNERFSTPNSDSGESYRASYPDNEERYTPSYSESRFRHRGSYDDSGSRFTAPVNEARYRAPVHGERYRAPVHGERYRAPISEESYRAPMNEERYRAPFSEARYNSPMNEERYRTPFSEERYMIPLSERFKGPQSDRFRVPFNEERFSKSFNEVRHVTYNSGAGKSKPLFTDDEERYYEKPKNINKKKDRVESEPKDPPTLKSYVVKMENTSGSKPIKGSKESVLCSRSVLENVEDLEMQQEDLEILTQSTQKLKSHLNNRLKNMHAQRRLMASTNRDAISSSKKTDASVGHNGEPEEGTPEKQGSEKVKSEETSKQESDIFLDNVMSNLTTKFSFKRSISTVSELEKKNKPESSTNIEQQNITGQNDSEMKKKEQMTNPKVIKKPFLSEEDKADVISKVKEILQEKNRTLNCSSYLNLQPQMCNDGPSRTSLEEKISGEEQAKSHTSGTDVQIPGLDGVLPPEFERIPTHFHESPSNKTKENLIVTKAPKGQLNQSSQENINSNLYENIAVQGACILSSKERNILNENFEKPNLNLDYNTTDDHNKAKHSQSLRSKLTGEISTLHKVGTPCGGALRGLVKRDKMMPSGQIASLKPGALYDLLNEDKPRSSTKTKVRPQVQTNTNFETLSSVNISSEPSKILVCSNENSFSSIKANSADDIISKLTENDLKKIITDNIGALPTPNLPFLNVSSRITNDFSTSPNSSSLGVAWNNQVSSIQQVLGQNVTISNVNVSTLDNPCKSNIMYHPNGPNWAKSDVNESRKSIPHLKDPRREPSVAINASLSNNHGIDSGQNLYNTIPEQIPSFEKPNYSSSIYARKTETLMTDKDISRDTFYFNSFKPSVTLQSDPYKSPCYDGSATPDPYRPDPYTMSLQDNFEKQTKSTKSNDSSEQINTFSRPSMLGDTSAFGESHSTYGREILQRPPLLRTPPPISSRPSLLGTSTMPQERELYSNFNENQLSLYNDSRNIRRAPVTYAEWKNEQKTIEEHRNRYRWSRDTISRSQEPQAQNETSHRSQQKDPDAVMKLSARDPRRKSIDENFDRKDKLPQSVLKIENNNQDWATRKSAKSSGLEQFGNTLNSTATADRIRDKPNQRDPRRRDRTPPRARPVSRDSIYASRGRSSSRGACRGKSPSWHSDDMTSKHHLSEKSKDTYSSPLDQLYKNSSDPQTGLGYGLQNFRIPKKNKSSFDHSAKTITKGNCATNNKKCIPEGESKSKDVSGKAFKTQKAEIENQQEPCVSVEDVSVNTLDKEESFKKKDDVFHTTNSDNDGQGNTQNGTPNTEKMLPKNRDEEIKKDTTTSKDCVTSDEFCSVEEETIPGENALRRRSIRLIKVKRGRPPKVQLDVEVDNRSTSLNQPHSEERNHNEDVDKSSIKEEKSDSVESIQKVPDENKISESCMVKKVQLSKTEDSNCTQLSSGVAILMKDVEKDFSVETLQAQENPSRMSHGYPNKNENSIVIENCKPDESSVMESLDKRGETGNNLNEEDKSYSSEIPEHTVISKHAESSLMIVSEQTKESTTVPCDSINTGPEIKIIKQVELLEDVIGIKLTPDKIRKMAEILYVQESKAMRKDEQPQESTVNDTNQKQDITSDVNLEDSQIETSKILHELQLKNMTENPILEEDRPQQSTASLSESDYGSNVMKSSKANVLKKKKEDKTEPQTCKDLAEILERPKQKRKYKNELDRLQDDISKYHDSEAIAAASGPRQCRLQKEKPQGFQITSQNKPIQNKVAEKKCKDNEFDEDSEEKSIEDDSTKSLDELDDFKDSSKHEYHSETKDRMKTEESSNENDNYQSDSSSDSLIHLYNEKMKSKYHFILQNESKGEASDSNVQSNETETVSTSLQSKNTISQKSISSENNSIQTDRNKTKNVSKLNSKENNHSDHDENFDDTELNQNATDEKQKVYSNNGLKKQRKKSFWSAGIIRRKTKSKRTSSSVSSSGDNVEPQSLDLEEQFMINEAPDINYYQEGDSKSTRCKLCSYSGKSVVAHYAITHPKDEVLISRMSPAAAEMAIKESKRFFSMSDEKKKDYSQSFECRVCYLKFCKFSKFFEHIALHSGEFRHECCRCGYRTSTRSGILKHYHTHNGKNSNIKGCRVLYKEPDNKTFFCGYLCSLCNYFQINEKNVKRHVENVHEIQDYSHVVKINFSKVYFSDQDLSFEVNDTTSTLEVQKGKKETGKTSNQKKGISNADEIAYDKKTDEVDESSDIQAPRNNIESISEDDEKLIDCIDTTEMEPESPNEKSTSTENQNNTEAYDSSDVNAVVIEKKILDLHRTAECKTEIEDLDSTSSTVKETTVPLLINRENFNGTFTNEISDSNDGKAPMIMQHDWFLSLCKNIAEINHQFLIDCSNDSVSSRVENLKLKVNSSNIIDDINQRFAVDKENGTPLDDFLNTPLSFQVKRKMNLSSLNPMDNSNNENVTVKDGEEPTPSRRQLPERSCKGGIIKPTNEKDNESLPDEEEESEVFKLMKESGDHEHDWNDDVIIKEENFSEYKRFEVNNLKNIGSNHQSLPCLSASIESYLSKNSNRKPLSIQDKFYSSSLPLNSNFSEFNYVMKQILQVSLKVSDIKEVKVGGLEALPNDSGVIFSCSVKVFNKECGYQTTDLETFGHHVNLSHHTAYWNGICCSCLLHFVQDPNSHDKFSVNTQSRAFCHLVREHLTFTKKTSKSTSRESLTMNDATAQVSDDASAPRLRVRRLSGDKLSGTENILPRPAVEVTGPEEVEGILPSPMQRCEKDPDMNDAALTVHSEMEIHHGANFPNPAETTESIKFFKPYNDTKGAKSTYKMESTYNEMLSDRKLRHLYKCMGAVCSFTIASMKEFARHFDNHKEIHALKPYDDPQRGFWNVCSYCLNPFSSSKELCIHVRKEHAVCTMQCGLCFYRAKSIANVHFHHSIEHASERFIVLLCDQTETNLPPFIEKPFTDFVSAFRCNVKASCSLFTYMMYTFCTHLKTSHPDNMRCHLCGGVSSNIKSLLQHYCKQHGIGLFQCLFCTFGAATEHEIRLHLCYVHPSTDPKALQRTDNALKPNTGLTNKESIKRLMFYKDQDKLLRYVRYPTTEEMILEAEHDQSQALSQEVSPETSSPCNKLENNRSLLQQTASALAALQTPIPSGSTFANRTHLRAKHIAAMKAANITATSPPTSNLLISPQATSSPKPSQMISPVKPGRASSSPKPSLLISPLSLIKTDSETDIHSLNEASISTVDANRNLSASTVDSEASTVLAEHFPSANLTKETDITQDSINTPTKSTDSFNLESLNTSTVEANLSQGSTNASCTSTSTILADKKPFVNYFRCGNKGCTFEASTSAPLKTHLVICDQARKSQKLKCVFCNRAFKQAASLVEHLRGHGPERYSCNLCSFRASLVSKVTSHMKMWHHAVVTSIVPVDPTKQDSDKDYFVVHGKEKRKGDKPGPKGKIKSELKTKFSPEEVHDIPKAAIFQSGLGCSLCSYETKVRSNLVRHILQHKWNDTVPQEEFVNPVPDKTEKMFDKMMNLAGSSHKKKSGPDGSKDETAVDCMYKYVSDQDRYKCHIKECGYRTLSETMLRDHISVIHKDETFYTCPHCIEEVDVIPIPIDQLSMHLKLHDSPVFKCAYCHFCSHIKRSIERHTEVLHPGEVVDVKAVRLTKPDQHLDQPAPKVYLSDKSDEQGEEWFCCNLCVFKTKKKKMILQHGVMEHKFTKPFKCSECGYASMTDQIFKDHFNTYHPDTNPELISLYKKTVEVKKPVLPPIPPLWKRDAKRLKLIRGIKLDEKGDAPPPVATATTGIEGLDVLELKFGHFGKPVGISFMCPRCSTSFVSKNRQEMKEHLYKDFEYNPVVCRICKLRSTQRTKIMKHINRVHNIDWSRISEFIDINSNEELENWVEKVLSRQHSMMNESLGSDVGEPQRKRRRSSVEVPSSPPPPHADHSDPESLSQIQEAISSTGSDEKDEQRRREKRRRDKCPSRHRFGCEYCNVTTKYKHSITLHCRKVHPGLIPQAITLDKIMEEKTEAYNCMYCNCTALNLNNMKYHWSNTHKNSGLNFLFRNTVFNTELEYECYWCKKRSDLESLEEHCGEEHSPEQRFLVVSISVPKYKCSECTSVFKSIDMLKRHFPIAHPSKQFCYIVVNAQRPPSLSDQTSVPDSPPEMSSKACSNVSYKCFNCPYVSPQYQHVVKHMQRHFVTFVCTECGSWFPSSAGLSNHRLSKHPTSSAKPQVLKGSETDIENAKKNIIVILETGEKRKITDKELAEAEKENKLDEESVDTYTYDELLEVQMSPPTVKETARKSTGSPNSQSAPSGENIKSPNRAKRNLFKMKRKKLDLFNTFVSIKSNDKIVTLPAETFRSILDFDAGPVLTTNVI